MSRKKGEETVNAAVAFEQYYDLGEKRSLELLAQNLYKKQSKDIPNVATILSQLKKWSARYDWQKQIIQRERAIADEKRKKSEKDIEAMNERQAMIGTTQQAKAIKQIEELIKAEKLGAIATVNLLKLAIEVEREARGANTQKVELAGKDGGPLEISGQVVLYLPKKDKER